MPVSYTQYIVFSLEFISNIYKIQCLSLHMLCISNIERGDEWLRFTALICFQVSRFYLAVRTADTHYKQMK
jgi:hypothetical protein